MNFLAHLTLSDDDDDLLIGNFVADFTRSAEYNQFKPEVVEGIKLHHKIDAFTDNHPVVEESKEILRERHGKYSGVIVDIFYDHFLASQYHCYGDRPLEDFAQRCYNLFDRRCSELTKGVQRMLPHMKRGNWLVNYATEKGMRRVFSGMHHRASFNNHMNTAVDDLMYYYTDFEEHFSRFFPELQEYTKEQIRRIPYS